MRKIIAVIICTFFICAGACAADKYERAMDDSLARGYLAASQNKIKASLDYFKSAVTNADKAKSWRGLVDCANAYAALGKPQESLRLLKNAVSVSMSKNDWRGCVASGYAYMALPEDLNAMPNASDAFAQACKIALKNDDWRGSLEGVKGLIELGETEAAGVYLKSARNLVENLKSSAGYSALSHIYKKLKDDAASAECFERAGKYQKMTVKSVSPPEGWKPAGRTIAGPDRISPEAQMAMRSSADMDIELKTRWLIEQQEKEKKTQKFSYRYTNYYNYPYYYYLYGCYTPLTAAELYSWGAFYLTNYNLEDGYYVYVGW